MSTESYDVDAYVVELRARIRELEAELATLRGSVLGPVALAEAVIPKIINAVVTAIYEELALHNRSTVGRPREEG